MDSLINPYNPVILVLSSSLVILERCDHFESRNVHFKKLLVMQVLHEVGTVHTSHFCMKVTTAYILILISRLNRWLHAHYSFSFHFSIAAIAVENVPMTAV